MKINFQKILTAILFFTFAATANAQNSSSISLLQTAMTSSLDKVFSDLQTIAFPWLGAFIAVQFIFTNFNALINGEDLEKVWAKFLASIFWGCICIYTFKNGPLFLKNTAQYLMNTATGTTSSVFDPISPINKGIDIASTLLQALDRTQSVLGSLNPFPAIMFLLISVVILAVSALLAFKILMIFIETKIVIALSPLSFALLGLKAFRDQGLAPFKYLVSMAYRIFLLGAVLSAMSVFSDTILSAFSVLPASDDPNIWPPVWMAAIGYSLLGALTLRIDSIAAMLASGSSQMSMGDAAAAGAIAGAAAGMAASATTDAAASAAATKIPQSMSSFMAQLRSGDGSINQAGGSGSGGGDVGTGLNKPADYSNPANSLSSGSGAGGVPGWDENSKFPPRSTTPLGSGGYGGDVVAGDSRKMPSGPSSKANINDNNELKSPESSGSTGSIGGKEPSNSDLLKAINDQKPQTQRQDHMRDLKNELMRDAPPVHIQMSSHLD